MNIAKYIDHTILNPGATKSDIKKICDEAKEYGFYSVCVNSCHVEFVVRELSNSGVKVAVVVGFPLGATSIETKVFETKDAVLKGADEIDMVINIGALKDKNYTYLEKDIKSVVDIAGKDAVVKVIIETSLLTSEEKLLACEIAKASGAHFVKTSTGFSTGGATVEDVKLMRQVVGSTMGVKASGGIRNYKKAKEMIDAGATRLGASASVSIMKEAFEKNK